MIAVSVALTLVAVGTLVAIARAAWVLEDGETDASTTAWHWLVAILLAAATCATGFALHDQIDARAHPDRPAQPEAAAQPWYPLPIPVVIVAAPAPAELP